MKLNEIRDNPGAHYRAKRIGRVAEVPDTPSTRGMIAKVAHLIRVIEEK